MKSFAETKEQWAALFKDCTSFCDLQELVKSSGSKTVVGLRSVQWKAFLVFEDLDQPTWETRLFDTRTAYSSLKEYYLKKIEDPNELDSEFDPLTDDAESPWNSLRQDENLRAEILQDVERCYQENFFFREPSTQKMMLDVLFVYSKLNEDIGYRQGMHELLAPVLWTLERDAIDDATMKADGNESDEQQHLIKCMLDKTFIEHDAFALFNAIMRNAKLFYEHSESGQGSMNEKQDTFEERGIVARSKRIHEEILQKVDPELADKLKQIDILPQVFIIRWLRLLFSREFSFDDVLTMWDALFASDPDLKTVDFICVVMLLRIRWQLLRSDYSSALILLLRYPTEIKEGPSSLVYDALYLQAHISAEGGSFLITKYSNKPPQKYSLGDRSKAALASHAHPRHRRTTKRLTKPPTTRHSTRRSIDELLKGRNTESVFHGVLDSFQRRTQEWEWNSVRKVVQDAAGEMRRSWQSQLTSPTRQIRRGSRPNIDPWPKTESNTMHLVVERDRQLANKLEDAVLDLQTHEKLVEIGSPVEKARESLHDAIVKVQDVLAQLKTFTLAVPTPSSDTTGACPSTPIDRSQQDGAAPTPLLSTNIVTSSSSLPSSPAPTSVLTQAQKTQKTQIRVRTPASEPATSPPPLLTPPIRRTPITSTFLTQPRPSLSDSSFSWMLGSERTSLSYIASRHEPEPSRPGTSEQSDHVKRRGELFGGLKDGGRVVDRMEGGDPLGGETDVFTLRSLRRGRTRGSRG